MNRKSFRRARTASLLFAGLSLLAAKAGAQQLIIKGMYGMKAGAMPDPGIYVGMFGAVNWADQLKNSNGDTISHGPRLTQELFGPLVMWVSCFKILGADYGAAAAVPFANTRAEFPRLRDFGGSTGLALSQLWVVPVQLGWHIHDPLPLAPGGADITFHYAFYAPTGRYTVGSPNNTSLGMWCNELSARITGYFDRDRDWHGSAALFYDINSKKQDQDWKIGNPFTYMGAIGRNFGPKDAWWSGWWGLAGYGQWQVTSTTGIDAPAFLRENKSTVYGIGPELTTLKGALTVRYFWQYGAKTATQGQGLYVQFAMPL